jgi:hypothetical protein
VNFLAAEAGPDMTVDADVLLSGLVQPAAAGYYRLDPEVRRHCLELLDAAYRGRQQRRSVDVAWFLLAYADALERQAALALDALTAEYLAIQRWVALAFIDPASAAAAFAQALARSRQHHRRDHDSARRAGRPPGVRARPRRTRAGRRRASEPAAGLVGRRRASRRRRHAAAGPRGADALWRGQWAVGAPVGCG